MPALQGKVCSPRCNRKTLKCSSMTQRHVPSRDELLPWPAKLQLGTEMVTADRGATDKAAAACPELPTARSLPGTALLQAPHTPRALYSPAALCGHTQPTFPSPWPAFHPGRGRGSQGNPSRRWGAGLCQATTTQMKRALAPSYCRVLLELGSASASPCGGAANASISHELL